MVSAPSSEIVMSAPSFTPTPAIDVLLDASTLGHVVSSLAAAPWVWRPHVSHDPTERTRIRLLGTSAYEVWLLGWAPGQSVGLHDHGDANGAFVVVEGELLETTLVGGHAIHEAVAVGGVGRIPAGSVHDVANRSGGNATSIHAYSRPLAEMGFYDTAGSLLRIEAVQNEVAAATLDDVARALHPAFRASL